MSRNKSPQFTEAKAAFNRHMHMLTWLGFMAGFVIACAVAAFKIDDDLSTFTRYFLCFSTGLMIVSGIMVMYTTIKWRRTLRDWEGAEILNNAIRYLGGYLPDQLSTVDKRAHYDAIMLMFDLIIGDRKISKKSEKSA